MEAGRDSTSADDSICSPLLSLNRYRDADICGGGSHTILDAPILVAPAKQAKAADSVRAADNRQAAGNTVVLRIAEQRKGKVFSCPNFSDAPSPRRSVGKYGCSQRFSPEKRLRHIGLRV
jgi:hypothetical protein